MKLVWSPKTASKAYLDTVMSVSPFSGESHRKNLETPDAAELISALAAGWNAKLIVETWTYGDAIASSIGLNVASQHANAKHVCIVQNSRTESAYLQAIQEASSPMNLPETIISQEPENAMKEIQGIDFLVVDWRHKELAAGALKNAAFGSRGAVVVCRNGYSTSSSGFSWRRALRDREVVRTVTLPVTGGIEIAHVAARNSGKSDKGKRRWITHIDQRSGEEHVFSV